MIVLQSAIGGATDVHLTKADIWKSESGAEGYRSQTANQARSVGMRATDKKRGSRHCQGPRFRVFVLPEIAPAKAVCLHLKTNAAKVAKAGIFGCVSLSFKTPSVRPNCSSPPSMEVRHGYKGNIAVFLLPFSTIRQLREIADIQRR